MAARAGRLLHGARRAHPGRRHACRGRRDARVRQRLPAPRLDRRRGRGQPEDAAVPVPRVDVRPRRAAARGAARGLRRRTTSALAPVRLERWGPFLFVNAGRRRRAARGLRSGRFRRRSPSSASTSTRCSSITAPSGRVAANWKVVAENFLECYHCAVAHPGFSALVDVSPDAYRLEVGRLHSTQIGPARDGETRSQFHFVWPNTGINVFPGEPNLSIGPFVPACAGAHGPLPRLLLRRRRRRVVDRRPARARRPGRPRGHGARRARADRRVLGRARRRAPARRGGTARRALPGARARGAALAAAEEPAARPLGLAAPRRARARRQRRRPP